MTSKVTTEAYYAYGDIPLKVYYEVASTGDVFLVQRTGKINPDACREKWEDIVKANSEANDNRKYFKYRNILKVHGGLVQEYSVVKAMITKLLYEVDKEYIDFLNIKGYRIYTGKGDYSLTKEQRNEKYAMSLVNASKRADNLLTKIQSNKNELDLLQQDNEVLSSNATMGAALANVGSILGFDIPDDILLCKFNEYVKIANAKAKQLSKHGRGVRA